MRLTIIVILFLVPLVSGLELSEILFDPVGKDDKKEFVELLGEETLENCVVSDSRSSDTLKLLQEGNEVILVVETDSPLNTTENVTVYGAGKAIGNGLGNTKDSLTITCNSTVLINTSYDILEIDGFEPGLSIIYKSGWFPGQVGGTPGIKEKQDKAESPTIIGNNQTSGGSPREEVSCNVSLAITLGKIAGHQGDIVHFTVLTDGYAEFDASADGTVFAYGDTLTRKEHTIELPNTTEVKLTAKSRSCDSRQRAVRIITVTPKPKEKQNNISNSTLVNSSETVLESSTNTTTQNFIPSDEEIPIVTGAVILDTDTNVIPWISLFGCIVLLVSGWLFWHISRQEEVFTEK